ncbi:uncharacterized protein LOC128092852 [Culex pipiens pallens]|uniref:uncharacterized protein LOC128092852 n=1 Tax=Culex pipiens pallens TaxID=42434 RepID=UPI0022AAA3A6|nr:uncharacterized protein LOC128092852 [Culex pipiens pallens]
MSSSVAVWLYCGPGTVSPTSPATTQPRSRKNMATPSSKSMRSGVWKSGSASWIHSGIGQSAMFTGDDGISPVTLGTIKHSTFTAKLLYRDWSSTVTASLAYVFTAPMPQIGTVVATLCMLMRFAMDSEIKLTCEPLSSRTRHGTGRFWVSLRWTTAVRSMTVFVVWVWLHVASVVGGACWPAGWTTGVGFFGGAALCCGVDFGTGSAFASSCSREWWRCWHLPHEFFDEHLFQLWPLRKQLKHRFLLRTFSLRWATVRPVRLAHRKVRWPSPQTPHWNSGCAGVVAALALWNGCLPVDGLELVRGCCFLMESELVSHRSRTEIRSLSVLIMSSYLGSSPLATVDSQIFLVVSSRAWPRR